MAAVRFGEGEGRLLAADPADEVSVDVAINKIRRQSGIVVTPEEMFQVRELVSRAFDEADIVGIHGSPSFNEEHQMWVRRIEALFEERLAAGRRPAYVSHCLFNSNLYEELETLISGRRYVSVISSRNVKQLLERDYAVGDARVYQVPSQFVMRDVDDQYEAALHDVRIWPGYLERLRDQIEVREPAEVFLVGAGLFGKELCIHVRELGGIALDIGSVLDKMAGKVTRGKNRPEFYRGPRPGA